jgi:integrase
MGLFRKYKTIEELLPGFLLEKETSTQHKTSRSYEGNAYVFIDWLKEHDLGNIEIRKITENNITDFFYYLGRDKGLDKPTCEKYFLHLRSLFNYAFDRGEIDEIPFGYVVFPRKKKDQGADVIHNSHLKPLLLTIKEKDPQLFLACMIEYYCFIRPGKELRLLKVGDIDCENGLITVQQEHAKNKIRQNVTMPEHLIKICKEYDIDKVNKSLYVFGKKKTFNDKPVSINMLRYRFNIIRDSLKLPKGYKLYSMKHTGASNLHKSGLSMRELMDQLRHTQLEATQHYLKSHCGIVNDRIRNNFPNPL